MKSLSEEGTPPTGRYVGSSGVFREGSEGGAVVRFWQGR